MKRILVFSVLFVLLMTSCAPSAAPTEAPVDVEATAQAMALTIVAQTQAAQPTLAPTEIPTEAPTALPTATLIPPTATLVPTLVPTITPTADPCNQPLTQWKGESAKLILDNQVENATVTISLFIVTPLGECGYMSATFSDTVTLTVPVGSYSAWAWVDGTKQDFSTGLSFRVIRGSWRLIVKQGRLAFQSGCAPNC